MTQNDNKTTQTDKNLITKIIFIAFGFAFVILHLSNYLKVSKSRLRKYYGVDGKTFNKWFEYFCADILSIEEFKKQRKITLSTYWQIKSMLGDISDCAVMRKIDIVNLCESDYRTLRKNIKHAPPSVGINIWTYDRLSAFPPKVCRALIDWFR